MLKLKWYYNRLKLMSIKEILFFRIPQIIQLKILGKLQLNKQPTPLSLNPNFTTPKYNITSLKSLIKTNNFTTKFPVFNIKVNLFSDLNWRKDYANNIESPIAYYGKIERQDFSKNGDVKFIAELNRFEFLPFIAFKAVTEEDKASLKNLEIILNNWSQQNPYLKSINWTSGIEVAIRSVNLIYTHIILKQFKLLTSNLNNEILILLSFNYNFLKNHLSLYSSANNHLMAELMGLNCISSYLNVSKQQANKWEKMLYKEIITQVNIDGVNAELCTRYHAEVTEQILITLEFLKSIGKTIPVKVLERFKKMFQFTNHTTYKNIETIFGDNDEGYVINPYLDKEFSLYNSQLKSSNFLFDTKNNSDGILDFRNYLIFGESFKNIQQNFKWKDTLFEESGYCFVYDADRELKFSCDVGPIGDNISAAHGHSDIFHFNIQVGNTPFIIDSGTYQYHSKDIFWRNYFKGITAHNTVSINNLDHAVNNGRMSWINKPITKINTFKEKENTVFLKATTNAFQKENVQHARTFLINKKDKTITIKDDLFSNTTKQKTGTYYLHFHPEVEVNKNKNQIILTSSTKKIVIDNAFFKNAELLTGDMVNPLAWYSKEYNKKVKTNTLKVNFNFNKSIELNTIIYY